MYIWLVVSTALKNMKVRWDYYSQYMGKKTCSKQQPTTYGIVWNIMGILDILEVAISSIYISIYIYIYIYIYISISIYLNIYISIIDDL